MVSYINNLEPLAIEIYRNDTVLRFKGSKPPEGQPPTRASIKELSIKSRRRLAFTALNADANFSSMLTLTYPKAYPGSGKTVKRHLNAFLTDLRRLWKGVKYLWFLEFQKRGAPHVHILIDWRIVEYEPCRIWASQRWYEIVASGDAKHLAAGINWRRVTHENGAAHYAVKYSMKPYQKWVPREFQDVGRFWGTSRGVKPKVVATVDIENVDKTDVDELYRGWHYAKTIPEFTSIRYNSSAIVMQNLDRLTELD